MLTYPYPIFVPFSTFLRTNTYSNILKTKMFHGNFDRYSYSPMRIFNYEIPKLLCSPSARHASTYLVGARPSWETKDDTLSWVTWRNLCTVVYDC